MLSTQCANDNVVAMKSIYMYAETKGKGKGSHVTAGA